MRRAKFSPVVWLAISTGMLASAADFADGKTVPPARELNLGPGVGDSKPDPKPFPRRASLAGAERARMSAGDRARGRGEICRTIVLTPSGRG